MRLFDAVLALVFAAGLPALAQTTIAEWDVASAAGHGPAERCFDFSSDQRLQCWTSAIQSGRFSGAALSALLTRRGDEYYTKEKHDQAIQDLDQAIRLDPQNVPAFYQRGLVYWYGKKDLDRALQDFSQGVPILIRTIGSCLPLVLKPIFKRVISMGRFRITTERLNCILVMSKC